MLQYETVLGPETDTPSPQPSPTDDSNGPSGQPDVEKGMGKGKGGKSFSVSGPGLADLHTDGNKEGVGIPSLGTTSRLICAVGV